FDTVRLPDGSELSLGGGYGQKAGSLYADPVYTTELRSPGGTWADVGNEDDARTYHSTAVLLPDGRVLSAGDDRTEHLPPPYGTGEPTPPIYSPPHLFGGARPAITSPPPRGRSGAPLRVRAPEPLPALPLRLTPPGRLTPPD